MSAAPSSTQIALPGLNPPSASQREVVQRRGRAVDDPVVRRGDRDEMPDEVVGMIAAHPLAGERPAEAVADDVDALRARERANGSARTARGRPRSPPSCARSRTGSSATPPGRTGRPGSRVPTPHSASTRGRRTPGRGRGSCPHPRCRPSGTACRCSRAGRSPASASRARRRRSRGRESRATRPGSSGSRPGTTCPPSRAAADVLRWPPRRRLPPSTDATPSVIHRALRM